MSDPYSDGVLFENYDEIDIKTEYPDEEDGEESKEEVGMKEDVNSCAVPNVNIQHHFLLDCVVNSHLNKKAEKRTEYPDEGGGDESQEKVVKDEDDEEYALNFPNKKASSKKKTVSMYVAEGESIYICELCKRHCRDYRSLGDHRRQRHKLPFRQEKLGATFQIDSRELHPERQRTYKPPPKPKPEKLKTSVKKNIIELHPELRAPTEDSVYVCQICCKDYKTYHNLKYHRKRTHGVPARQEYLGRNFDIPTETLHPLPAAMKEDWAAMAARQVSVDPLESQEGVDPEDSIYVCQVCSKTLCSYRQLGNHRKHTHKLPFRQNTLGKNGEISSYDVHPENKSTTQSAMMDSVYVCEVCGNDYKNYQNLKYHRKHTHKLQARQERLGISGEILTDDLHPIKHCPKKNPGSVVIPKSKQKKAQTSKCDLVYVCEVCHNDYKSYTNLKYHRKRTHNIAPRQNSLGINGEIDTNDYHPLRKFQKVGTNGEISVHRQFPKGFFKKQFNKDFISSESSNRTKIYQYKREMYYQRLIKHLENLQQTEDKTDLINLEIESLQEIQSLRNEASQNGHSELFLKKLKTYHTKHTTVDRKFRDVVNDSFIENPQYNQDWDVVDDSLFENPQYNQDLTLSEMKQYQTEMYYQRLIKHLENLQQTEEKTDLIKLEIETIQEIQSLRNESSENVHSELFLKKLRTYKKITFPRKFDDAIDDSSCFEDPLHTDTDYLDPLGEGATGSGLFYIDNDMDDSEEDENEAEELAIRQENQEDLDIIKREIIDGNEIYIKEEPTDF